MLHHFDKFALVLGVVIAAAWASAAAADPCKAIDAGSTLTLPYGATFQGRVVHVIDGDSLCVAVGEGQNRWVEVRLADFNAPEFSSGAGPQAKAALERIALGREARCKAGLRTYDRVAASCEIGGRSVGELMRGAGVREGGNGTGQGMPVRLSSGSSSRQSSRDVYFPNCAAARAAGAAPILRGDPGYGSHLDRDGDGRACEPLPR